MKNDDKIALPAWLIWLLVGLIAAIILVLGYIIVQQLQANDSDAFASLTDFEDPDFNGIDTIQPPREMPNFTLTGTDGDPISLSDLPQQPTLIFFGFTNCPDICPITLGEMKALHDALDDEGDDLNYVFISVDGERDTPEHMGDYLALRSVDAYVTGLTGNPEDVRRIGADYGVKFVYGTPDDNGNYNVDHTSSMFLLDSNREWIRKYAFNMERDVLLEDIQQILDDEAEAA